MTWFFLRRIDPHFVATLLLLRFCRLRRKCELGFTYYSVAEVYIRNRNYGLLFSLTRKEGIS